MYTVHIKFVYCDPIIAYMGNKHGVPLESIKRMYNDLLFEGFNETRPSMFRYGAY